MAYDTATRTRLYQEAFDRFVQERQLDIEYPESWSTEDSRAWGAEVERLRKRGIVI